MLRRALDPVGAAVEDVQQQREPRPLRGTGDAAGLRWAAPPTWEERAGARQWEDGARRDALMRLVLECVRDEVDVRYTQARARAVLGSMRARARTSLRAGSVGAPSTGGVPAAASSLSVRGPQRVAAAAAGAGGVAAAATATGATVAGLRAAQAEERSRGSDGPRTAPFLQPRGKSLNAAATAATRTLAQQQVQLLRALQAARAVTGAAAAIGAEGRAEVDGALAAGAAPAVVLAAPWAVR